MPIMPMGQIPDPIWRQMVLKTLGITQRRIAAELGESESTVSRVIAGTYDDRTAKGRARRDRIRQHIAEACHVPVAYLFVPDPPAPE